MKNTTAVTENSFPLTFVLTAEGFIPELPWRQSTEAEDALLAEWKADR